MGRLVDCDKVFNAIQITTDNFGVVKHVVESNMQTMLSKIPTVRAIPIPKGATNLDMLKAVFPNIKITYSKYDVEGTPHIIMAHGMDGVTSFTADWANAPYVGSEEE